MQSTLSFTARWARLGCKVLTNTTSPQCLRNPQGREGGTQQQQHDKAHESGFSKHSVSARETHSAYITMPDMVIWAIYACMLGRTGRSARLRGALIHTY